MAKFNKDDSLSLNEFSLSFNIPSPVLESAHIHTKWFPTGLIASLKKDKNKDISVMIVFLKMTESKLNTYLYTSQSTIK